MTLYLIPNFNYYNRNIVKYDTIKEYTSAFGEVDAIPGINFIPNDGIRTTQIVNYTGYTGTSTAAANGEVTPGYVLVVDDYTGAIVSRWWVIESTLVRNGQEKLNLLRDVIADYRDIILNAPSFITKGYISSINDTAIFNNEDISFNQIKYLETPIQDASKTGWYVGYLSKEAGGEQISISNASYKLAAEYTSDEDFPYNSYRVDSNPFVGEYTNITFRLNYSSPQRAQGWDENGNPKMPTYNVKSAANPSYGAIVTTNKKGFFTVAGIDKKIGMNNIFRWVSESVKNSTTNWRESSYALTGAHRESSISSLLALNGEYIRIGSTDYRVQLIPTTVNRKVEIPNDNIFAQSFKAVAVAANALSDNEIDKTVIDVNNPDENYSAIEYSAEAWVVNLIAQTANNISYTVPSTRNHCIDAPYDLICIPAGNLRLVHEGHLYNISSALSRRIVESLILSVDKKAYDWQLLPYCPLSDTMFEVGTISSLRTSKFPDATWFDVINDEERDNCSIVIFPSESNFRKVNNTQITVPTNPVDFKVENECNVYRLCSPNYNGQFEFSATKNGGVNGWNISCSYKPFNPYIKVAPKFNLLYGRDFEDARGLVCGGDFSIAQTADSWQQYQINNKNYQVMFDRQIENMEVNNAIQRKMEKWNVATGAIQGITTGAMAGGMTGNPYAAAAGAVIGGSTSLAGGIADIRLNEQLRAEALDYTKDQYGYQLQNIKAMPLSLTKVGAATIDYKMWPFVEYFSCTEVEKQALRDKLTWNGMTIGRIGRVADFLNPEAENGTFVQAKPIRLEAAELEKDSHFLDVISIELQTGVYIVS